MAIEKNCFKSLRFDSEFSSRSMSSEEDDELGRHAVESDDGDDSEYDDCDSGAGSDDFDLLELGETGEEFCQVGDQTCSVPFELYDLPGLEDILSMEVWNEVLTEEERIGLAKYLPDMDQDTYMRTMKELFTGGNMHFGVPMSKLFNMLKGGLCEPRVALYQQGLGTFQKRRHYHDLRKYQNSMVTNLYQIRDAWLNCRGYSIDEKLRVLNIMKNQKSLMYEKMEELDSGSSQREESGDGMWSNRRPKDQKKERAHYTGYRMSPNLDYPTQGKQMTLEPAKHGRKNSKGNLRLSGSKPSIANPKGREFSRDIEMDEVGDFRLGNKYDNRRGEEYINNLSDLGLPLNDDLHPFGRSRDVNQLSDIKVLTAKPSSARLPFGYGNKYKHFENTQQVPLEDLMRYGNVRSSDMQFPGSRYKLSDGGGQYWHDRAPGDLGFVDPSFKASDWNVKSKKGKMAKDYSDHRILDNVFHSEHKTRPSKGGKVSVHNGPRVVAAAKGMRMLAEGEDTESDSSGQFEEDGNDNPLMRSKWAYPGGVAHMISGTDSKRANFVRKDKMGNSGDKLFVEGEIQSLKAKQKGKMSDRGRLNNSSITGLEDSYFLGPGRRNNEVLLEEMSMWRRGGHLQGDETFPTPSVQGYPGGKRHKGEAGQDYSVLPSAYLPEYFVDEQQQLIRGDVVNGRSKKIHMGDSHGYDYPERSDLQLVGCSSKKRRVKDELTYIDVQTDLSYLHSSPQQQIDDITFLKKKGKRKWENGSALEKGKSEPPVTEVAEEEIEEKKPQKKPYIPITPTVHTGFSFSIIHLLSAVRMAMITLLPDDSLDRKPDGPSGSTVDINNSEQSVKEKNVPSLTVQEIVNRVRSNPGDPCILETQEPLQDLVRGVLKIFSSKTAPLGAKGWKSLVQYEKPIKSWSWIGPASRSLSDHEAVEEVTSPDSWGLPHKMLVKLVDSFANWLKNGQETLQQIGSLPAPPLALMQVTYDEKERFRDLRAQKSLNTISQSPEEVRAYFRKEEVLRYSIPDRAFSYTAVDGKKSTVAPSKKGTGKPSSKARDHFMLKRDRPAHVTILCLVRDAASRLPGSIGTRADVCTLIRDSQYIVEDVSDAQVNQVVSGALDRLHYERDPCVQFDGERKLWVYLHREREEEDFEDDGTSSTKKWKRQKKEVTEPVTEPSDGGAVTLAHQVTSEVTEPVIEPSDGGAVTLAYHVSSEVTDPTLAYHVSSEVTDPVAEPSDRAAFSLAYHVTSEQTGFDFNADLNAEPSRVDDDKRGEFDYFDGRHQLEDTFLNSHLSEQNTLHPGPSIAWEDVGLNPVKENTLLPEGNPSKEDFDVQSYSRDAATDDPSKSLS